MSTASALELIMLNLVNGEREAAGLEPLRLITLLNQSAEDHSRWMLEADAFSHVGDDGSTPSDRMEAAGYPFEGNYFSAENIAWQSLRGEEGFEDDIAQLHANLMASPDHRANILDPNAEDIGIGIEIGTFTGVTGDFEAIMATQNFGRTATDISAWLDPLTGADDAMDPPVEGETAEDEPAVEDDAATADPDLAACEMYDETYSGDEAEDDVIAEADEVEDESDTVVADSEDEGDVADDALSDEDGEDVTIEDLGALAAEILMPCDLTKFTLDLSDVFEFRQEGDQLIWETSEEKLMAAFQRAFDAQMGIDEETGEEDALAALMLDEMEDATSPLMLEESDATEDWLLDGCAA